MYNDIIVSFDLYGPLIQSCDGIMVALSGGLLCNLIRSSRHAMYIDIYLERKTSRPGWL